MAEKLTKKEAVRRALAALGNDAMPVKIQGWIKDNLDIEMTAGHVSTTKGEILRKPGGMKARAAAPEHVASTSAQTPSKAAAVRQALSALGKNATRTDIQDWVKRELGVEMTLDHISTSKAEALRKMKVKTKSAKKQPAPATTEAAPKPKVKPAANGQSRILVSELLELKTLLKRIGPDQLLILIEALTGR
jgi:hypothetical protein